MEQQELFADEMAAHMPDQTDSSVTPTKKATARQERPVPQRKRKARQSAEDFYGILGLDADAPQELIKEKYLQKIRQFRPETHPEEFQAVRKAYETLRDPVLRKEYDSKQQHGASVEELVKESAQQKKTQAGMKKAKKLLQRALDIEPRNETARRALARIHLYFNSMVEFELEWIALKKHASVAVWPQLWNEKLRLLCESGRAAEAYEEVRDLDCISPQMFRTNWEMFAGVYEATNREAELLAAIEKRITASGLSDPAEFGLYIGWIYVTSAFNDSKRLHVALQAARTFLRQFRQSDGRAELIAMLCEEYQECRANIAIDEAKLFAEMALSLDKNNRVLQGYYHEVQTVTGLMKEFERACEDDRLFPLVIFDAAEWLADEFHMEAYETMRLDDMQNEYRQKLQQMNEAYATGILRLKKRYPLLYRQYQPKWEQIFKEKTAGMNREERRFLRM